MKRKLKPEHPLYKKFEELLHKIDELGISVEFGCNSTRVKDRETGVEAFLLDIDAHDWSHADEIMGLPCTDFKLRLVEDEEDT